MNANAVVSVGIVALALVGSVVLGLLAVRKRARNLEEWSVGGRSMGLVLTWVLMAGETYTSFSYLGAAGWSYTHGLSGLYLPAYLSIGMAVTYVTGPVLWSYAHRHGLHSDLRPGRAPVRVAVRRWTCRGTGRRSSSCPTSQLQITGMGAVLATISYGTISLGVAYLLAFLASEAFILVSGLRGSAWVSALKDSLVVADPAGGVRLGAGALLRRRLRHAARGDGHPAPRVAHPAGPEVRAVRHRLVHLDRRAETPSSTRSSRRPSPGSWVRGPLRCCAATRCSCRSTRCCCSSRFCSASPRYSWFPG